MANNDGSAARAGWVRRHLGLFRERRWLPTLMWAIAMLVVSSIPNLNVRGELFPGCDKVFHFIEYSILGIALRYWSGRSKLFLVGGGMAFGALDELHQTYVPGRETSFLDFLADASGVVVGFLISRYFIGRESHG